MNPSADISRTAVALLNWNGRRWLEKFLPPLLCHTPGAAVYVIDNGSTDDSIDFVQQHFPQVNIIRLDRNYGFAGGYNRGLLQVAEPYVVVLNTDVEVTEGWLPPLLARLTGDEKTVAVQPKILDYNRRHCFEYAGAAGGYIDFFGYPYCRGRVGAKRERDAGQYDHAADIHWASGACMLIRKEVFLESGGFDETFFAHQEEIDWQWRVRRKGYRVVYEPASAVYHVGGGNLNYGHPRKTFLNFRNNLLMLLKNLPAAYLLPVILARLVLDGGAGLQFLLKGRPAHTWAIVRAHFSFYRHVPRYIKHRSKPYLKPWWKDFFFMRAPLRREWVCEEG